MQDFDFTNYEINDDIVNYDGFVTSIGFLKVRSSDAPNTYPTHSDYAREYMRKEWGMDFDNSLDALKYMTNHMGFVQYSNGAFFAEGNPDNVIDVFKVAGGEVNAATANNLMEVWRKNQEFYKTVKESKKR